MLCYATLCNAMPDRHFGLSIVRAGDEQQKCKSQEAVKIVT